MVKIVTKLKGEMSEKNPMEISIIFFDKSNITNIINLNYKEEYKNNVNLRKLKL